MHTKLVLPNSAYTTTVSANNKILQHCRLYCAGPCIKWVPDSGKLSRIGGFSRRKLPQIAHW